MNTGCSRGTDQQSQILQKVKVKQSLYSRWKPISSESIKMAMRALEAAIGLDVTVFRLSPLSWLCHIITNHFSGPGQTIGLGVSTWIDKRNDLWPSYLAWCFILTVLVAWSCSEVEVIGQSAWSQDKKCSFFGMMSQPWLKSRPGFETGNK